MSPLIWAIFFLLALIILVRGLARRFAAISGSYYLGINTWGQWLPVGAAGLYFAVLVVNLASFGELGSHGLNLGHTLSAFEMIFLLMIGPLLLTRWSNLVGTSVLIYLVNRLVFTEAETAAGLQGILIILAASTTAAVIGDKAPWLAGDAVRMTASRMREILLVTLSIAALGAIAIGMVKYVAFGRWFNATFDAELPIVGMLAILTAVFVGWLSIALGFTRNFMMPVVALPTLTVVSYVTGCSTVILFVPFFACLALSLSSADRRGADSRRVTNYRTTAMTLG